EVHTQDLAGVAAGQRGLGLADLLGSAQGHRAHTATGVSPGAFDGRPSTVSGRSAPVVPDAMYAVFTSNGCAFRWSLNRPSDAPVLLRRRLDRVERRLAGDEVAALRHVARRVDVGDVGAEMVVDDDAAVDLHAGALEPVEVRLDTGGHDHDVADEIGAGGELQPLLALGVLDLRDLDVGADGDAVGLEPALDDLRARGVHHARQDPRRHL